MVGRARAGRASRRTRRARDQRRGLRHRPGSPARPPVRRAPRALLGTVVLAFGGAPLYLSLWIFSASDARHALPRVRKEAIGKAEEKAGDGRGERPRDVSVAAFCALVAGLVSPGDVFRLAAAAALATALMDTVGTEIGQAVASPTALLPDLRRVPPGTDGAVSVVGTLAGLAAAAVLAAAGLATFLLTGRGAVAVVLAACLGTVLESLLGRAGAPWRVSNGHVLNFVNTLAGAVAAPALSGPRDPVVNLRQATRLARPFTLLPPLLGISRRRLCVRQRSQPGSRARVTGELLGIVAWDRLRVAPQRGLERLNQITDLEVDRINKPTGRSSRARCRWPGRGD